MDKEITMDKFRIPEITKHSRVGVNDAIENVFLAEGAQTVAIKVLIVAYNDEITKLLKESILKSQEIERLKRQIKGEE